MTFTDLLFEGEGQKTISFQPLPISIHIPNLKALGIILLKLLEKNMIFVQKKGHPADVERLAMSLGKQPQGQYYT